MKAAKKLKLYFNERDENVHLSLKKLRKSFAPENFHQLRVEIKKIKALSKFISFYSKKIDRNDLLKPYQTIFKEAGKVRELQVEEALFKKNKSLYLSKEYRLNLKELRLKKQAQFCQKINSGLLKDLESSSDKILPYIKKAKKEALHEYAKKNWHKVQELLCKEKLMTAEVHKLRKRLKSLYYILKISGIKVLKKLNKIKLLTEIIGQWHDRVVMCLHIQKAMRSTKIKAGDLKALSKMKVILSKERKVLFQKINKEVKASCI